MSAVPIALAGELVGASLAAWRLPGAAARIDGGAIVIAQAGRARVRIEPAAHDPMFRWMVTVDGRRRPAQSLLAVLRQVRAALDPGHAATRVRVGVGPVLVP